MKFVPFPRAVFLILVFAASIGCVRGQTPYERDLQALAESSHSDSEKLHRLFELNWEYSIRENPEFATYVGRPGFNHLWTDNSLAAIERRKKEVRATRKTLESIRASNLSESDRLNFELFRKNLDDAIEGDRFGKEYLAINQMGGVQQDAAQTLELAPRTTVKDFDDMIARLNGLPRAIDQTIALLEKGLESGITPPRITLRDVPRQVMEQMIDDPDRNPLLKSFTEMPSTMDQADRTRLRREAAGALRTSVLPAFAKLHEFLTRKYIPGARESVGMNALPGGREWYAFNVRTTTTTDLSPEEIHQIGLAEVKRIRAEMEKVIAATGFRGSFEEFSKFVRTDPGFYYTNRDDLIRGYREIAKRIDPELARFFGRLPRLPYGVLPIPEYSERSQTTAYYQPGSPQAGRPGYFYANTYALNMRPKWEMEALTAHEAVPGHHFQIALAQEMESAPEFRKHSGYTAFVEGWGLYAESLAGEMGLYKDPYMKFGQLTYEMWRAIRLVVDTGLHSKEWSRQQAIDYFLANSSKTEHDVMVEVDRYIVWPGQALAYKIGELKIKELRQLATRDLGAKFDIRRFHDHLLSNGAVPLDILEARTKSWIAEQR